MYPYYLKRQKAVLCAKGALSGISARTRSSVSSLTRSSLVSAEAIQSEPALRTKRQRDREAAPPSVAAGAIMSFPLLLVYLALLLQVLHGRMSALRGAS